MITAHNDSVGRGSCRAGVPSGEKEAAPRERRPTIPNLFILPLLTIALSLPSPAATPLELAPHILQFPENTDPPLFVDIDGDGLSDLLVLDPAAKQLLNYHQRADGFRNAPDQIIPLPPQTIWVAVCDLDSHPGLELLFSTAYGLIYSRQNGGLFESEQHVLIEAAQTITNNDSATLTWLHTNTASTNLLLPVFVGGQTIRYHRNSAYAWSPDPPLALVAQRSDWTSTSGNWTLGAHPAHQLTASQSFVARTNQLSPAAPDPDTEVIRKILAEMPPPPNAGAPHTCLIDINGDGRPDLVVWQTILKIDLKTDLYIFLRGQDGRLPDRPSQVLHENGAPIPFGATMGEGVPLCDLKGDGGCELVLINFKTVLTSAGGLIETFLTHGVDFSLKIRSFHHGAFPTSAETSVSFASILPAELMDQWPFFIMGDFNGDHRPDLLVRRSETLWQIYPSTADSHWFASEPAYSFNAPVQSYFEITDLNGDGLDDIICHEPGKSRVTIFLSPSRQIQGKKP